MKKFFETYITVIGFLIGLALIVAVAGLPAWVAIATENYWWLLLLFVSVPLPLSLVFGVDWRRNKNA